MAWGLLAHLCGAYQLAALVQFYERLVPPPAAGGDAAGAKAAPKQPAKDFSSLIEDEVEDLKAETRAKGGPRLLQLHNTNIGGLMFIILSPQAGWPWPMAAAQPTAWAADACSADWALHAAGCTPAELLTCMAEEVERTQQNRCRCAHRLELARGAWMHSCHARACTTCMQGVTPALCRVCLRFLPIEVVCAADMEEIRKASKKLCAAAFPEAGPALRFAVQYEHRASKALKRDDVIAAIADAVPKVLPAPALLITGQARTLAQSRSQLTELCLWSWRTIACLPGSCSGPQAAASSQPRLPQLAAP